MKSMKDFYRAKYKDSLFVIKTGGRVISDEKAGRAVDSSIEVIVSTISNSNKVNPFLNLDIFAP